MYHPEGEEQAEDDFIYDLKAICNHSGSASGGHYYCYARDENDGKEVWNEYNDSSVFEIQPARLVSETAYVLFYERKKNAIPTKEMIQFFESFPQETKSQSRQTFPENTSSSPSNTNIHTNHTTNFDTSNHSIKMSMTDSDSDDMDISSSSSSSKRFYETTEENNQKTLLISSPRNDPDSDKNTIAIIAERTLDHTNTSQSADVDEDSNNESIDNLYN